MSAAYFARSMALPVLLGAGAAQAAFVAPDWERGTDGSAYLEWETFVKQGQLPSINTVPDVGSSNVESALLVEQTGDAFVTSAGNLYTFTGSQAYTLDVVTDANGPSPLAGDVAVNLQIRTWSREIADRLVTLNGDPGEVTVLSQGESFHPTFGTFTRFEYLFRWNVAPSSAYRFAWDLDQSSTSLDAVVLDMYASGTVEGLLAHALLPILPQIPGSSLFDGRQLYPEDLLGAGYPSPPPPLAAAAPMLDAGLGPGAALAFAAAGPAPIPTPLPATAPLLAGAVLGAALLRRRKGRGSAG